MTHAAIVAALFFKADAVTNAHLFWMATIFLFLMFLFLLVIWWGLRRWLRGDIDER
jgi:hypothetical protein